MLKELLLRKGWAGKTISRAETVERLNPIIRQLTLLNHTYDAFVRSHQSAGLASKLDDLQKIARMDVGKLAETVFSCGGTAYSGTDVDPADFTASRDMAAAVTDLAEKERAFIAAIENESEVEHQMRTRAILSVVKSNAEARLTALSAGTG